MKNLILAIISFSILLGCQQTENLTPISNQVYREIIDTSYANHVRHKMDIYLPENRDNNTHIVIFIHGGEWTKGSKSDMSRQLNSFKKYYPNYALANINYRYVNGKDILINDQLEDVQTAIQLILNNKQKFNISDKIILIGESAGAHLAMMYAYKYDKNRNVIAVANYYGPTRIDSEEWYNSINLGLLKPNKDVVYPLFGKYWDKDLYAQYSPFVSANNGRPTISFHAPLDPVVPIDHARDLTHKLQQLNIKAQLHEYPLSIHNMNDNDLIDSHKKLILFLK